MLKIENLYKRYANSAVNAVDGLTLHVRPGELFGFLGPNGAGKTTTIKMLTGILPFQQGEILINGTDVRRQPIEAKHLLGYVPDGEPIYDKLTGAEYLNFMGDIYGVTGAERAERTEHLLTAFRLKEAIGGQIRGYSHGMKRKLTVIGALLHSPKLWVLDEPLSGLDPQSSFELKSMMRRHCDGGNTVFFSTHVLEVAEKLCDRIGIINEGRLVFVGGMREVKEFQKDGSLEQVFLKITGGDSAPDAGGVY
jgi:ABC-2 type transport system ATP-binding protein